MATAIEFENVSKQYRLGVVSTRTLGADFGRWWAINIRGKEDPYLKIGSVNDRSTKADSDFVWALREIDFSVEQGEVLGIIGRNGAGKSTLLKLLSKVTAPTTGTIRARGRLGTLLEVGTGFHPEMTGRENIYLNGAILGMSKYEITSKLDEIVDFSGCERYIDTPTKRYSSGMTVRLGFAVAAFLEPEILVVDEVLAVGDAEFQKKALGKMQEVSRGEGRTVLFVSHNMNSIRKLCTRGLLLNNGTVQYSGDIESTVDEYIGLGMDVYRGQSVALLPRQGRCSGKVRFSGIEFLGKDGNPSSPRCGDYLKIRLHLEVEEPGFSGCRLSFDFADVYGTKLSTFPTDALMDGARLNGGSQVVDCIIPRFPLTEGVYRISLWCAVGRETADFIESLITMEVVGDDFFKLGRKSSQNLLGRIVLCDYSWNIQSQLE